MAGLHPSTKKRETKSQSAFKAKLELIKKHNMSKTLLVDMYKNSYLSRKLDDAEISMKKQSKAFFQI